MPKVSVCIPTYQQPEYFNRALVSVLEQEFTDFEIIVTDDSRGDDIASIVREASDSRILYVKNGVRLGSPANWNTAVARARGDFIKFLHHDDWLSSRESLGKFVTLLENEPEAQLGFSASNSYGPDERLRRIHSPSPQVSRLRDDPRVLLLGNWIGAPSATIYRRTVGARFDENLRWVVDIDFYLAVLTAAPTFAYCEHPLVSVTDGAAHQVTNDVARDPKLELFEWFFLYAKWAPMPAIRGERAKFLDSLLSRLDVRWRDYRAVGLHGRAARLFVAARLLHGLRLLA